MTNHIARYQKKYPFLFIESEQFVRIIRKCPSLVECLKEALESNNDNVLNIMRACNPWAQIDEESRKRACVTTQVPRPDGSTARDITDYQHKYHELNYPVQRARMFFMKHGPDFPGINTVEQVTMYTHYRAFHKRILRQRKKSKIMSDEIERVISEHFARV